MKMFDSCVTKHIEAGGKFALFVSNVEIANGAIVHYRALNLIECVLKDFNGALISAFPDCSLEEKDITMILGTNGWVDICTGFAFGVTFSKLHRLGCEFNELVTMFDAWGKI